MKNYSKKALSLLMVLCLMLFGAIVSVSAASTEESATHDCTSGFTTSGTAIDSYISIKTSSTNTYTNPNRIYKGSVITISSNSAEALITSIVLNTTSSSYASAAQNGTYSPTATVTTSSNAVTATFETASQEVTFTASSAQVRVSSVVVNYLLTESSDPKVVVTGTSSFAMINGEQVVCTATPKNIDGAGETEWLSSDETVATVDSEGKVTALKLGTTNITATINGVESNEYKIDVYPDNNEVVDITTALAICELTGTVNSPYKYTVIGEVVEVGTNTSITDGTETIIAYNLNNRTNLAAEDRIAITGYLVNYNGNTPEFAGYSDYQMVYTVTFDSNGGSSVSADNNVISGTTVAEPIAPTRAGYTFYGWYNGETPWDFESDTVTSDITLTAQWLDDSLNNAITNLNNVQAYMSAAYKYSYEKSENTDTLTSALINITGSTYVDWSGKCDQSTAQYAGNSYPNADAIQIRTSGSKEGIISTVSGGLVTSVTITLGSTTTTGRVVEIYGSNTPYTSTTELYNANTKGTLLGSFEYDGTTTTTTIEVEGDYAYVGIKSKSGALYLASLEINWSGNTYSDVDFRFKCAVDETLRDIAATLDGAIYGIEVSCGETSVLFPSTDELYVVDGDKAYVLVDLGDVLNNRDRLDDEFTVRSYIEYDGTTYYSTTTKTYSVYSIIQAYVDLGVEEVTLFKEVLESFGYTFNTNEE